MDLADKLASLAAPRGEEKVSENNQLDIADELEKTLDDLGIQVQPRFDIPLAHRIGSIYTRTTRPT